MDILQIIKERKRESLRTKVLLKLNKKYLPLGMSHSDKEFNHYTMMLQEIIVMRNGWSLCQDKPTVHESSLMALINSEQATPIKSTSSHSIVNIQSPCQSDLNQSNIHGLSSPDELSLVIFNYHPKSQELKKLKQEFN